MKVTLPLPRFLCYNLLVSLRGPLCIPSRPEEKPRRRIPKRCADARFLVFVFGYRKDSAGNVERHVDRLADVVRGEIVAVVQPLQEGDVVLIAQAVGEAETVDRVACDELVCHDLVIRTGGGGTWSRG